MPELIDNQSAITKNYSRGGERTKTTDQPPAIISKKWLCAHFRLEFPRGGYNYDRLHRLVLTDTVIEAIGMTPDQVRRRTMREFDAVTSLKLIQILNL